MAEHEVLCPVWPRDERRSGLTGEHNVSLQLVLAQAPRLQSDVIDPHARVHSDEALSRTATLDDRAEPADGVASEACRTRLIIGQSSKGYTPARWYSAANPSNCYTGPAR